MAPRNPQPQVMSSASKGMAALALLLLSLSPTVAVALQRALPTYKFTTTLVNRRLRNMDPSLASAVNVNGNVDVTGTGRPLTVTVTASGTFPVPGASGRMQAFNPSVRGSSTTVSMYYLDPMMGSWMDIQGFPGTWRRVGSSSSFTFTGSAEMFGSQMTEMRGAPGTFAVCLTMVNKYVSCGTLVRVP